MMRKMMIATAVIVVIAMNATQKLNVPVVAR